MTLPGPGRRPLAAIFITIAESGERKSTVDRLALQGVADVEDYRKREYVAAMAAYQNSKKAWDVARRHAERNYGDDRKKLEAELNAIGPEPKKPEHPMMLVGDPTPEGLIMHLEGTPVAGIFTDEGGSLIGGVSFNDENSMKTGGILNKLWDADPIRRARVTTGSTFLPGRRCTSHIMMQPVVAEKLLGSTLHDGMGLTARMLIVAPTSTAGTREHREPSPGVNLSLLKYTNHIRDLLLRPFRMDGDTGALDPMPLPLSADARATWVVFYNECEREIGPKGALVTVKGFGAKLAEHAGRIAAVLTVYDNPDATEVPLWAMQCGIRLAYYYGAEALRLRGHASISPDLRLAETLLQWWRALPSPELHLSTVYQFGPRSIRDAKTAKRIVEVLEDHGHVERLPAGTVLDGKQRKEAWKLTAD